MGEPILLNQAISLIEELLTEANHDRRIQNGLETVANLIKTHKTIVQDVSEVIVRARAGTITGPHLGKKEQRRFRFLSPPHHIEEKLFFKPEEKLTSQELSPQPECKEAAIQIGNEQGESDIDNGAQLAKSLRQAIRSQVCNF